MSLTSWIIYTSKWEIFKLEIKNTKSFYIWENAFVAIGGFGGGGVTSLVVYLMINHFFNEGLNCELFFRFYIIFGNKYFSPLAPFPYFFFSFFWLFSPSASEVSNLEKNGQINSFFTPKNLKI